MRENQTQQLNLCTKPRIKPTGLSGVSGVYPTKSGRWKARIEVVLDGQRKQYSLGTFDTLEEATSARLGAEVVLGYKDKS